MRFRPVHVIKVGRFRINWRVGKYRWAWDFERPIIGPATVVTPVFYVSWGLVRAFDKESK